MFCGYGPGVLGSSVVNSVEVAFSLITYRGQEQTSLHSAVDSTSLQIREILNYIL